MCISEEEKERIRKHSLEHPIFGTDLSQPRSKIIAKMRSDLAHMRGQLSDIYFAFPGWKDRLDDIEGLMTCGIVCLYNVMKEMEEMEKREETKDEK